MIKKSILCFAVLFFALLYAAPASKVSSNLGVDHGSGFAKENQHSPDHQQDQSKDLLKEHSRDPLNDPSNAHRPPEAIKAGADKTKPTVSGDTNSIDDEEKKVKQKKQPLKKDSLKGDVQFEDQGKNQEEVGAKEEEEDGDDLDADGGESESEEKKAIKKSVSDLIKLDSELLAFFVQTFGTKSNLIKMLKSSASVYGIGYTRQEILLMAQQVDSQKITKDLITRLATMFLGIGKKLYYLSNEVLLDSTYSNASIQKFILMVNATKDSDLLHARMKQSIDKVSTIARKFKVDLYDIAYLQSVSFDKKIQSQLNKKINSLQQQKFYALLKLCNLLYKGGVVLLAVYNDALGNQYQQDIDMYSQVRLLAHQFAQQMTMAEMVS